MLAVQQQSKPIHRRVRGMTRLPDDEECSMRNYNTCLLHSFNSPFLGLSRWAGTRKVKPIWILLKQETVSGSGISWAICKSAPRSRQITTPAPYHSVFFTGRVPFLSPNQQRQSTEGISMRKYISKNWVMLVWLAMWSEATESRWCCTFIVKSIYMWSTEARLVLATIFTQQKNDFITVTWRS